MPDATTTSRRRVLVVGSGPRFLSGISYYTNRLVRALADRHEVSTILIRQLLPTRVYPGRERVGAALTRFTWPAGVRVWDGIDWFWGRSLTKGLGLVWRTRPEVVVLQWWTGTVLHTYLVLAVLAKLLRAKVVMEFHEVLDTAELGIAPARWYVNAVVPWLVRMADGFVVHTEFDREALEVTYGLGSRPLALVSHASYDQYIPKTPTPPREDDVCRLLYFGVIRPFKGVEDLIAAFDGLSPEDVPRFHLTVVGETWEGWEKPAEMISASPHADRITFVNRYVADDEVAGFFADADAVVLPYHRSSASGPLHVAMACGLPVVVSAVGGLVEATSEYDGAYPVPPRDPDAIRAALLELWPQRARRYADPHSWSRTVDGYDELFAKLGVGTTVG